MTGFPVNRWMVEVPPEIMIGGDAGVPPVAVGERMNLDNAVMEARSRLERLVSSMFCPESGIVEQHSQSHRYLDRIDSDIFLGQPERTGPPPYVSKKSPMQFADESFGQPVGRSSALQPRQPTLDIGLLQMIQFGAAGNVPEA